jgi:hypothetical protein
MDDSSPQNMACLQGLAESVVEQNDGMLGAIASMVR